MQRFTFQDGSAVPRIGQGTWRMGEVASERQREVAALRLGIDCGLRLIDTAEMYGEGGAEQVVGEAIAGRRDDVYIVSKIYPHNASRRGTVQACERSLRRLGTEVIDLYLLHWPGSHPLEETVEAFEQLRDEGKIRAWGVSNFDADELASMDASGLAGCTTDQVLYHPQQRGIEFDLLPWSKAHAMPLMAYCPLGQGGRLLEHPVLWDVAQRHGCLVSQVALAWGLRHDGMVVIPKASDERHVRANARALETNLTDEDLAQIDAALPGPERKVPLAIV
ncbi:aldo/keto reductase [Pseudomonas sp. Marseille-QA0892]